MKPAKKKRGDAVLRNLPRERQQEIFTRLTVTDPAWPHGPSTNLDQVQRWLAQDGLQVGTTALSDFYAQFPLSETFERNAQTAEDIKAQVKKEVPDISDAELDAIGQRTFSYLSIREQDADTFIKLRSARFKAELETAKLELRKQSETRLAQQAQQRQTEWQFDAAAQLRQTLPAILQELKLIEADNKLSEREKTEAFMAKLFGPKPQ